MMDARSLCVSAATTAMIAVYAAILRASGYKALHDEDLIYANELASGTALAERAMTFIPPKGAPTNAVSETG